MRLSSTGQKIALLVLFATTIGCDRVTKSFAETNLAGDGRRSMLGDTIRLEYTENTGGFLGLGADWPAPVRTGLFTVGTGAILIGMLIVLLRSPLSPPAMVGAALFVAGGVSNLVDRVFRDGGVIDFMNVGIGSFRTGIFNVADMALMLGLAVYVVTHLRSGPRDAVTEAAPAPAPDAPPADATASEQNGEPRTENPC
jgi:signal peptidase II